MYGGLRFITPTKTVAACSVGWFVSLLVRLREKVVLLTGSLLQ